MGWLFEPGFFSSAPVHTAVVIGGVVAVVSAAVGIFTVIRGQSFAGHSLADVSTAGGSGALLLGLSPLTGFLAGGILGALSMDAIGVQRVRGRDVATGIVLGAATGCAALFLYLDTTTHAINGATQQILFGSIFTIDPSTVPVVVACSARRSRAHGPHLPAAPPELAEPRGRRGPRCPGPARRVAVHGRPRRRRRACPRWPSAPSSRRRC